MLQGSQTHRLTIKKDLSLKGAICVARQQIGNNDADQRTNDGIKKSKNDLQSV
jgi:hypothetical protein